MLILADSILNFQRNDIRGRFFELLCPLLRYRLYWLSDATLPEPGTGGVVSLEPQPFLLGGKAAPKSQWVTVEALWYRPSDLLEGLRRTWGRFEGKGAVGGKGPSPVASSAETIPPGRAPTIP